MYRYIDIQMYIYIYIDMYIYNTDIRYIDITYLKIDIDYKHPEVDRMRSILRFFQSSYSTYPRMVVYVFVRDVQKLVALIQTPKQ